MPFIPHTDQDIREMLQTIGAKDIDALFAEIPEALRHAPLDDVPSGISEMELMRLMRERSAKDGGMLCFIGAGAYEHHIPAAVWDITTRGEFMTAYTPYQAEASQGSLQLIYEYQSMMASLMGMEVSNASLYEGASALAEAVLMAARLAKHSAESHVLMPATVHPHYRQTVEAIVRKQHIHLIDVPYDAKTGMTDQNALATLITDKTVALVIPQPNFFGVLEDVDALSNWANSHKLLSIAVVNPLAMSLLKPPGEWGEKGVDITCGEGQPLGIPLASGGPYYGFLCARKSHVRQMPGRIVGKTLDKTGKLGYVLTLQAREQHIRRAKATSNICTNQGLMVTASTIYMSLMGARGLRETAALSHERARLLQQKLAALKGVEAVFSSPYFHECVLRFEKPVPTILHELALRGIQGGYALENTYPSMKNTLLICTTEMKTENDIAYFATSLMEIL